MQLSVFNTLKQSFRNANRWFYSTPERALDQAYDAALKIKAIEDEHFDGSKISAASNRYSDNALAFFQAELQNYLKIAKIRLTEFKTSRSVVNLSNQIATVTNSAAANRYASEARDQPSIILEKLKFIDEILDKYKPERTVSSALVPIESVSSLNPSFDNRFDNDLGSRPNPDAIDNNDSVLDKTGVLPRSILGTLNRIKRELDPKSEDQMIQSFRNSKVKTVISVRFILLLIIVPLLTQQLSKNFLFEPMVHQVRAAETAATFINFELEEEAFAELQKFEEKLKFQNLIKAPPLSQEEIETKLKEKAEEIEREYRDEGSDAIANVFADLLSVIAFVVVVATNKREIAILKSFIDETVYGLSDSAKAFIIILFTDMFVGFHSPHGWEVLLEGVSRHLGLPANRDFIFLFIATFPVILDTIFKYWIFRYLNRISPSAVATYRNMNEG
ncbi:MAG: proton extrusion protein PcxA [Scytolyngbya sp. HA4215-MV1]|jgi:hypothetical protein|nr:proton extrusion protein PcxA [Scytolyngbya sp. HA4215-MV1]